MTSILRRVAAMATRSWPRIPGGDPNLIDTLFLADSLVSVGSIALPKGPLPAEEGLSIVECIEGFIAGTLIRFRPEETLGDQLEGLAADLHVKGHTFGVNPPDPALTLALSFYLWQGCLCAAKTFRRVAVGGMTYTPEFRASQHADLLAGIATAEATGNPWLRYGAKLGRGLRQKRGEPIFDDGIPKDSPLLSS